MKKLFSVLLLLAVCVVLYSCENKKDAVKEGYVNPVFKENLNEIYDVISKRYSIDYTEVKKKFGDPVKVTIDSVQSEANQEVYDSTFVFAYKNVSFHYYKRSVDKKYLSMGTDFTGEFKTKSFTLTLNESKDEILTLLGNPALVNTTDYTEELTYTLYKDENGAYYDSIILIFYEEKFTGLRYVPYVEIYTETSNSNNNKEQGTNY